MQIATPPKTKSRSKNFQFSVTNDAAGKARIARFKASIRALNERRRPSENPITVTVFGRLGMDSPFAHVYKHRRDKGLLGRFKIDDNHAATFDIYTHETGGGQTNSGLRNVLEAA